MTSDTPPGSEAGMITAFVAIVAVALFLLAGIVLDGGLTLAGKVRALDEAQEAARAGAQQLDLRAYRTTGTLRLDQAAASTAARAYLAATGDTGRITATPERVTVTVTHQQHTQILRLAGISILHVTSSATARPHSSPS